MTPLKGGDGSRLPNGQQLVFQLSHATEQTAPSDCHPSSMGVCRFIYLHCLKQCGILAASPWNLISSLVVLSLCLFDMASLNTMLIGRSEALH